MPSELPPRRLHPFTLFFDVATFARRAVVPAVIALVRAPSAADVIVPIVLVVALGGRLAGWLRRTYSVQNGVLRLEEGLLSRRRRAVPLDRIQQVDVRRTVRHRVLGVATLRVETAGDGGGPELDLSVVSNDEVDALRALLLRARVGEGAEPPAEEESVLVALSPAEVALAGVTGAKLGVMLTVVFSAFQLIDDIPGTSRIFERVDPSQFSLRGASVVGALMLLVPVWLGMAAAASLLTDAGFTMVLRNGELAVSRGLLERREAVMALSRIQVVRVSASFLRRPIGRTSLRIDSAGSSSQGAGRVTIPILRRSEAERLAGVLVTNDEPLPALARPPAAALRRRLVRGAGAGTVAGSLVALAAEGGVSSWLAVLAVAVALGMAWGWAAYRGLGHGWTSGCLVAQHGAVSRRLTVTPLTKVQSARVRSSPFQRWAGLASAHADIAVSGVAPTVVDEGATVAAAVGARLVGRAAPSG